LVEQLAVHEDGSNKELELAKKDTRIYLDRRDYLIDAVAKRRKKIRDMAIGHKGGRCMICGYDRCLEALEFHHSDSSEKDFGISAKGYTRSWARVKEELEKCQLVCANCHREIHSKVSSTCDKSQEEKRENCWKP